MWEKMNLIKGQEVVILSYAGAGFIAVANDAEPTFTLHPANVGVNPKVMLFTVKEDEHCDTDTDTVISCYDGSTPIDCSHIVGARPRNIVRR